MSVWQVPCTGHSIQLHVADEDNSEKYVPEVDARLTAILQDNLGKLAPERLHSGHWS